MTNKSSIRNQQMLKLIIKTLIKEINSRNQRNNFLFLDFRKIKQRKNLLKQRFVLQTF